MLTARQIKLKDLIEKFRPKIESGGMLGRPIKIV